MAAFGQNHRRGLFASPPIAANKGMGLMEIADVFNRIDHHELADFPRVEKVFDPAEGRGKPKHVANKDFMTVFPVGF